MQLVDTVYTQWNPTTAYSTGVEASVHEEEHISVLDADLGTPVPVACLRGFDGDRIQVMAPCPPPLEFKEVTVFTASSGVVPEISLRRRSKIVVASYFTEMSQVDLRVCIKTVAGLELTIGNVVLEALPGVDDNGWYQAEVLVLDTLGGDVVRVKYAAPQAGEFSLAVGAV